MNTATMNNMKQSHYIIRKQDGSLMIDRFVDGGQRTFSGCSGRDMSTLYYLPMAILSHENCIGDEVVITQNHLHSAIQSKSTGVIVAKYQHDWDMSKPIGQRKSNEKKTSNWDAMFSQYSQETQIRKAA